MKFRLNIILIVIVSFTVTLQAQKKAFEIEDLYKVKYIGSPALSNDGEKIVFTVTTSNLKEAKSNTEIFVVNVDGSDLKQLTNNEAADFNPIWKNDDSGVLFSSTRDGEVQTAVKQNRSPILNLESFHQNYPRMESQLYSKLHYSPNAVLMWTATTKLTKG